MAITTENNDKLRGLIKSLLDRPQFISIGPWPDDLARGFLEGECLVATSEDEKTGKVTCHARIVLVPSYDDD
jgi:hypothetical protein